jgi:hypothetical protein
MQALQTEDIDICFKIVVMMGKKLFSMLLHENQNLILCKQHSNSILQAYFVLKPK